jgi:hypothetical protein
MHEWEDVLIFFGSIKESPSDPLWSEFPYSLNVDTLWFNLCRREGGRTSD